MHAGLSHTPTYLHFTGMRRFLSSLVLLAGALAVMACSVVKQLVSSTEPPAVALAKPVTYEARPSPSALLTLKPDGTFTVNRSSDSTAIDSGTFTLNRDTLVASNVRESAATIRVGTCRVTAAWLFGSCVSDSIARWREKPQRIDWPPYSPPDSIPLPSNTTRTAFLGERQRDLNSLLLAYDEDDVNPSARDGRDKPPYNLRR